MKILCFAGFKHVGKSFLALHMSRFYGVGYIDLDERLSVKWNLPISDIYKNLGKEAFYQEEFEALQKLDYQLPAILALGGGTLLNQTSRQFLKEKVEIVILESSFEVVKKRILNADKLWVAIDPDNKEKSLQQVYQERIIEYRRLNFPIFRVDRSEEILKLEEYVREFFR